MRKVIGNLREARECLTRLAKELASCAKTARTHGYALMAFSASRDSKLPFLWACLLASAEWGSYLNLLRDSCCHNWAEGMIDEPHRFHSRSSAGQRARAELALGAITGEYWDIPHVAIDAILEAALAGIREERHLSYTFWANKATLDQRHEAERKQLERRQKRERRAAGLPDK